MKLSKLLECKTYEQRLALSEIAPEITPDPYEAIGELAEQGHVHRPGYNNSVAKPDKSK